MEVDEAESVVGLIERDMLGGVGDVGLDGDVGIILGVDRRGVAISWLAMLLNVLFDEALFIYLVDNALTVGDEGSHCFGEGEVS